MRPVSGAIESVIVNMQVSDYCRILSFLLPYKVEVHLCVGGVAHVVFAFFSFSFPVGAREW